MRIRLITIDLDDTLWPCAPVIRDAEDALYAWLEARAPRLTAAHDAASLREHRCALMQASPEIAHDVTALRLLALRLLLDEFGYDTGLADDAMALFQQRRNLVQPYADVPAALQRLRDRYRLVALTNGNAEVHKTPLRDVFHRSLTAAEAGAAKPEPAMFELAMRWAGAQPGQTLHVGDDPLRDVEAARRVGIDAVWINRDGQRWPDDLEPPALEIADLEALVAWLDTQAQPRDADAL